MTNKRPLPIERCPHLSKVLQALWPILSIREQEQLTLWATCYCYEPGEIIYFHSEKLDHVFILAEGQVKISQHRERTQTMRIVAPSELFGYSNFFAESPSCMQAMAIKKSIVYHFPIEGLESIISQNASVAQFFIRSLSNLLLQSYNQTLSLTQKHVRGRLADALLGLSSKFGECDEETGSRHITISRGDLSDLSNMTQSNVSRTLKAFEEESILKVNGKKIFIQNINLLKEVSKLG